MLLTLVLVSLLTIAPLQQKSRIAPPFHYTQKEESLFILSLSCVFLFLSNFIPSELWNYRQFASLEGKDFTSAPIYFLNTIFLGKNILLIIQVIDVLCGSFKTCWKIQKKKIIITYDPAHVTIILVFPQFFPAIYFKWI
jgi:hypothetical protein